MQSTPSRNHSKTGYVSLQFAFGDGAFCFSLHWTGEMLEESMTQCFLHLFFSPSLSVLSIFNAYKFYLSPHRQSPSNFRRSVFRISILNVTSKRKGDKQVQSEDRISFVTWGGRVQNETKRLEVVVHTILFKSQERTTLLTEWLSKNSNLVLATQIQYACVQDISIYSYIADCVE